MKGGSSTQKKHRGLSFYVLRCLNFTLAHIDLSKAFQCLALCLFIYLVMLFSLNVFQRKTVK